MSLLTALWYLISELWLWKLGMQPLLGRFMSSGALLKPKKMLFLAVLETLWKNIKDH